MANTINAKRVFNEALCLLQSQDEEHKSKAVGNSGLVGDGMVVALLVGNP